MYVCMYVCMYVYMSNLEVTDLDAVTTVHDTDIFRFLYCCCLSHLSVVPSTAFHNISIFPQHLNFPSCCAMKIDSMTKWT